MNLKYLILPALLFIITTAKSQSYNLKVNNGYGSGLYFEGDTVHLWAQSTLGDTLFSHWSGNGQENLLHGNEWHNRLVLPINSSVQNIEINAHYDILSKDTQIGIDSFLLFGIDRSQQSIRTYKKIYYGIPTNPKAMVFLIHGTGGSGISFFKRYERFQLIKELLHDGFAVFGVDANESTLGDIDQDNLIHWDNANSAIANSTNNIDIKNMSFTRDSIIYKFDFPSNIPTFSLGVSNGSNFSDLCASALHYKASAHITAKGKSETYERFDIIPIIWIASENDNQENANNEIAKQNFDRLSETQSTSEFHWFRRSPFYPQRFYRSLADISHSKSNQIFEALKLQGHLNSNNYLNQLETDDFLIDFIEQNNGFGLSNKQLKNVRDQFLCVNADHVLNSDFNKRIIKFFNHKLIISATSSNEKSKYNIEAYPNPFSHSITIKFDNSNYQPHTATLFNISGTTVRKITNIRSNRLKLERGNLTNGVYFIQLHSKKSFQTGKLVIKR